MHRADRRRRQELHREIAVGYGVQAVGRRAVEAQGRSGHVAVDGKRGSRQCRRSQRTGVQTLAAVGQAAPVAVEHFYVCKHVVAEGHRLSGLQVCKPRHRVSRVIGGSLGQGQHGVGYLRR